ncbi:MAG: response regulator transcription factor [Phaeodactylibacter sp.]|nr:response regulator transcription factor [Phaeodactylibacter sp.]MCB9274048.1 response regulator transcription factor [Lewinellaceae bacterium]
MKKIRAIIVDDEKASRDSLAHYLRKYCPDVTVVQECANIQEAHEAIRTHQPELAFLDIEMPYGNAFDLLEQLEEVNFEAIFITAFSQYAIQALNLSAAYYILKPIDIDELVQAVSKVKDRLQDKANIHHARILRDNLSKLQPGSQRVVLPLLDGFEAVDMQDILYCEAADNFTYFHLKNGERPMICRKLKFYDELLSDHGFCRIHRSYMANLRYVRRYIKGKGGFVVLENGTELPVANARKGALLEHFR